MDKENFTERYGKQYDVYNSILEENNKIKGISDILWIIRSACEKDVDLSLSYLEAGFSFLYDTLFESNRKIDNLVERAFEIARNERGTKTKEVGNNDKAGT